MRFLTRIPLVKKAVTFNTSQIARKFPARQTLHKAYSTGSPGNSNGVPLQVSCDWLNNQLNVKDKSLSVVDVTWYTDRQKDAYQEFAKRHIPGAVYLDIFRGARNTELIPMNVPSMASFEASLQESGIHQDTHVVLYDSEGRGGFYAGARAYWQMKLYGKDLVSVLNGGLQMWESLGYPVTTEITDVQRGDFRASYNGGLMSTFEDLQLLLGHVQLVDARSAQQFKSLSVKGSVNVPFSTFFKHGALKTEEELKQMFAEKQLDLNSPIVTVCNLGNTASTAAFALKLVGAQDVSVYYGSMTEWQRRADPGQFDSSLYKT